MQFIHEQLKVHSCRFGKIKQVSKWNSKGENTDMDMNCFSGCNEKEQVVLNG